MLKRLIVAAIVAIAASAGVPHALAADRDPVLEAAQAHCIQEGMLRGFAGDALQKFVITCAATKRVTPRDVQPFAPVTEKRYFVVAVGATPRSRLPLSGRPFVSLHKNL